ncbi:MAG TPA: peptide chain release factor N(5)-glutamine methyltransferase [Puia sp.]|nr:peptide chain release factor N(5)-glutamine methyltransferase [Puia sp.]
MDWSYAQKELSGCLLPLYGDREASIIADWVMEALSGMRRLDRLMVRATPLSDAELAGYERYKAQLLAHRPVQYVLGESWFAGMRFFVDERVLIPRPETEELVEWVISEVAGAGAADAGPERRGGEGRLLDVGTGSGCIAVTLARRLAGVGVVACDISEGALAVARKNAAELGAEVGFFELDFLDRDAWERLPSLRWLVSNPPYIPVGERLAMARHVIDHEPASALFVPDGDALVFYRALGEFARERLGPGGSLFAEIHEDLGPAVCDLLTALGAREVHLRKDLQGKDRMIKAGW